MDKDTIMPIKLKGIATKPFSRGPIGLHDQREVSVSHGLAGDYRGAQSRRRQITLLSTEDWQFACNQLGVDIPWFERRANLLIEGHTFESADVGRIIRIGQVVLEITTDTPPCRRMDSVHPGLADVLRGTWRGGVSTRVLEGGLIRIDDEIELLPALPEPQLDLGI